LHSRTLRAIPARANDAAYGALNSAAQLEKVECFIDRLPAHAPVVTGGKVDRTHGGYFFEPTVVVDVRQDDEIVQEGSLVP